MLAGDDRAESGSKVSRLVTTQWRKYWELGITAMMPGKTAFCDRNNTNIHWTPCTVYTYCICSYAWFANGTNSFYLCIQVFNLGVCLSVLCVQNWDPGGQWLYDQDRISCSQGCPWNVKIKYVMEVSTNALHDETHTSNLYLPIISWRIFLLSSRRVYF